MNKSRQTFDPQKYQKPSRENLTKANNTLLHYRTSAKQESTEKQRYKMAKAETKISSTEILAKSKATGRPIGRKQNQEQKKM